MATKPQTGGPVSEDFQPSAEWLEEEGSHYLLLHLPGFVNEQINFTMESPSILKIHGERPLEHNKWSSFQKDIHMPENCNIRDILCKFEDEILFVQMPKTILSQAGPKDKAETTQETPIPQQPVGKPKPQTVQEDIPQKDTSTINGEKQIDRKTVEVPSPQKIASQPKFQVGQDETPLKASSTTGVVEQIEKKSVGLVGAENVVQKTDEKKEKSETHGKPTESKKSKSATEKTLKKEKESREESKEPTMVENVIKKSTVEKEKGESDGSASSVDKEKPKEYLNYAEGKETKSVNGGGGQTLENYKRAVKGLARGINEERQSMVNMGLAALVIIALGVNIAYMFGSFFSG